MKSTFIIPILSTLIVGCSTFGGSTSGQATLFDRSGIDIVIDHNNGIGYIISDAKETEKFCKSPSPDALSGQSSGISLGIPTPVGGTSIGDNSGISSVGLGGRSPAVLVTREIMYRFCEFDTNHRLNTVDAINLFRETVSKVVELSKALALSQGVAATNTTGNVQAPQLNLPGAAGLSSPGGLTVSPSGVGQTQPSSANSANAF